MNEHSRKVLRSIEMNDTALADLGINEHRRHGFNSSNPADFSRLGEAIGKSARLKYFAFTLPNSGVLDVTNREFFEGLKRNSSIREFLLNCQNHDHGIVGGVEHEILKAYMENNTHLTRLAIYHCGVHRGADRIIAKTLRCCTNLRSITLNSCNITDGQVLPVVEAIRGHRSLETLNLVGGRIGNRGCEAIATLLSDSTSNIRELSLHSNRIGNEGASMIANSLANNTNLQRLILQRNLFDQSSAEDSFSRVLCDATSINSIYLSNHTFEKLNLMQLEGRQLALFLRMNESTNKSHVAIRKILKCHPNFIEIDPLFEWGAEEDGDQTIKALPHVISWFEKARMFQDTTKRNLYAIYQFARAMPLLFEGVATLKTGDKKRKRVY